MKGIALFGSIERIVTLTTGQGVRSFTSVKNVIIRTAGERIVTRLTIDRISTGITT